MKDEKFAFYSSLNPHPSSQLKAVVFPQNRIRSRATIRFHRFRRVASKVKRCDRLVRTGNQSNPRV